MFRTTRLTEPRSFISPSETRLGAAPGLRFSPDTARSNTSIAERRMTGICALEPLPHMARAFRFN
jgi:hypothetical protein